MQDLRVLAEVMSERISDCSCLSTGATFDGIVNAMRANPKRYYGGIIFAPNVTAASRARVESLLGADVGAPVSFWRVSSDSHPFGEIPEPNATRVTMEPRDTTFPIYYMNSGDVVEPFRYGYALNALRSRELIFDESRDAADIRIGGPYVANAFTLQPFTYVAMVLPVFVPIANLSAPFSALGCSAAALNRTVPAMTLPDGSVRNFGIRGDECDPNDPTKSFVVRGRNMQVPLWGWGNASERVAGCQRKYADGPLSVLSWRNVSFVGSLFVSLYMSTIASASLTTVSSFDYLVAAEDVTVSFSTDPCLMNSTTMSALGAQSFAQSVRENGGSAFVPRQSSVRSPARANALDQGITLEPVTAVPGVWRIPRIPITGTYSVTPGGGFFMFAMDTRARLRDACVNAQSDADFIRNGQFTSTPGGCNAMLTGQEYAHHASSAVYTQSFIMPLGGRIWHLQIITPSEYAISRQTSIFALSAGLVLTALLSIVAVGALAIRSQHVRHLQLSAAQSAHELTVSYAAHELRNPLFALDAARTMLREEVSALEQALLTSHAIDSSAGSSARDPHAPAGDVMSTGPRPPPVDTASESSRDEINRRVHSILADTELICRASDQLHHVVNDFTDLRKVSAQWCVYSSSFSIVTLDFVQLQAGKLKFQAVPTSIATVLHQAVDLMRFVTHVPIQVYVAPDVPAVVHIDARRLRQVVDNALTNAAKHTRQGQITVCARVSPMKPEETAPAVPVRSTCTRAAVSGNEPFLEVMQALRDLNSSAWYHGVAPDFNRPAHEVLSSQGGAAPAVIEASAQSGVSIAASSETSVSGMETQAAVWLEICVLDTGAGLRGRTGQTLFEPFVQGAAPTTGSLTSGNGHGGDSGASRQALMGSGLGLSLAALLVTGMHGFVALAEVGGRTVFGIRLPVWVGGSVGDASARTAPAPTANAIDVSASSQPARLNPLVVASPAFTAITVAVPAAAAAARRSPVEPVRIVADTPSTGAPSRMRVLVVDDDAVNRSIVVRLLNRLGISCDTLSDGLEVIDFFKLSTGDTPKNDSRSPMTVNGSLRAIRRGSSDFGKPAKLADYDAILLDIITPGLSGIETCKRLRAAGYTRLIIPMTANGSPADLALYQRSGFSTAALVKPFTREHLHAVLNSV